MRNRNGKRRKQLEIQIKQRLRGGKELGTRCEDGEGRQWLRGAEETAGRMEREAGKDQNWRRITKTISKLSEFLTAVMMKIPQVSYMHAIGMIVLAMAVTRLGERCHSQRVS
jgi:hypothetical protein